MQRTPGSHKGTVQNERRDTHGIQGVSEKEEIQVNKEVNFAQKDIKALNLCNFNNRRANYYKILHIIIRIYH